MFCLSLIFDAIWIDPFECCQCIALCFRAEQVVMNLMLFFAIKNLAIFAVDKRFQRVECSFENVGTS